MEQGMNMRKLRAASCRVVLDCIREFGKQSRKDIAERTGLTQASLTKITQPLIDEGVLYECGKKDSGGAGRRKVLLSINSDYATLISITISQEETKIIFYDLGGNEIVKRSFVTDHDVSPKEFLVYICNEVRNILTIENPELGYKEHKAVGIAMDGIVKEGMGICSCVFGLWHEDVPVKEIVEEELHLPTIVESSINAFATSERVIGGQVMDHSLFVKWGPGLTGCILDKDEVFKWATQIDFGQIRKAAGVTLDSQMSGQNFWRKFTVQNNTFWELWENGTEEDRRRLEECLTALAHVLSTVYIILKPKHIVILGSVCLCPPVCEHLMELSEEFSPGIRKLCCLRKASIETSNAGVAAIAMHEYIF